MKELGRQVYLGGYEHEEHAAEAYDVAALKCKGFRVRTNFDAERCAKHSLCPESHAMFLLQHAPRLCNATTGVQLCHHQLLATCMADRQLLL